MQNKSSFQKMIDKVSNMFSSKKSDSNIIFQNKYNLDNYVDQFWFLNCPDTLKITQLDKQVRNLIH